ncbi:hypothetical protein DICA1_C02828 [Diutina catenulata]
MASDERINEPTPDPPPYAGDQSPYRPDTPLQHHIDRTAAHDLKPQGSAPRTEYYDILPSFQMYQSILKRDDAQFNEDLAVPAPRYDDPATAVNAGEWSHPSAHDEYRMQDNRMEATAHNENVAVTRDAYGSSVLDTIDRLPRGSSSPLDIQIYVTKDVPKPYADNELETRLREYSAGDLVHGYLVVTNTSAAPVDFGLFMVSLEGTVKSTERGPQGKFRKILMKKFLKMYDLHASYGYTMVPSSAGIEYPPHTLDGNDGTIIALPDNRVLQPHTRYKKFFTFKFPTSLLDNACADQMVTHILPPPTFGLDRTCFYNRGEGITINKMLGYGFLDIRGTPLLTNDYSWDDVSISYTIEAKFIDKKNKRGFDGALEDIDDPNKYEISKSAQYYLRFVPDIREHIDIYDLSQSEGTGFHSQGIDRRLWKSWSHRKTWHEIAECEAAIEREVNNYLGGGSKKVDTPATPAEADDDYFMRPARGDTKRSSEERIAGTPATVDTKPSTPASEKGPMEHTMASNVVKVIVKKKKLLKSVASAIGTAQVHAHVPSEYLPYTSPKLLMRYNTTDATPTPASSVTQTPELAPVSSHSSVSDIYAHQGAQNFVLDLEFNQEGSGLVEPPVVNSVAINLVFWTYTSEYPVPFEFSWDFFNPSQDFQAALAELKQRGAATREFLTANPEFPVTRRTSAYLNAIATLAVKKDVVKRFFKPVVAPAPHLAGKWAMHQTAHGPKWTKRLEIPLDIVNRDNVASIPSFQTCLVGRIHGLQAVVRFKGHETEEMVVEVPVMVG